MRVVILGATGNAGTRSDAGRSTRCWRSCGAWPTAPVGRAAPPDGTGARWQGLRSGMGSRVG